MVSTSSVPLIVKYSGQYCYLYTDLGWSAWVGHSNSSVCPEHNSKRNEPKLFKLGTGNDLGISYFWYGFAVERSSIVVEVK